MWFRRDLRVGDHPALAAALADGARVLPLFVLDPALWDPAGDVRRAYLLDSLRALDEAIGGRLHLRTGDPADVVPTVARELGAAEVHVSDDFAPYGRRRDDDVDQALARDGAALVRTGSPYAVSPGRVRKADGTPYRVYTPFARAWSDHGWRKPVAPPLTPAWTDLDGADQPPARPDLGALALPAAGERAALERWARFLDESIDDYAEERDRPDHDGTSALSTGLRWGEIHPRTLLADLGPSAAHDKFRKELAWREFYADVLFHEPGPARHSLRPEMAAMQVDADEVADERFAAWCAGRTGYPFVDAGLRQLRAEGWMHNRARMVVASFLVKDLHVDWTRGARWFMQLLRAGDLASNQHGWQWVAGTGTDAAPYFRVFNPVTQGLRFDPEGDYVRRWIPELRGVDGTAAHEPWKLRGGTPAGYPERIVDHAVERREALRRYELLRGRTGS